MRRVVVTGVGIVSPCGLDTESTWEAIVGGRSGIARIQGFDPTSFASQIGGEATGFDPEKFIERKRVREGDRLIHLAIAASQHAVDASGFEPDDELKEETGVFIGVGMCGIDIFQQQVVKLHERGPRKMSPYFIPAVIANLAPGQVSMRFGFRGPSYTTTSACSSGAHAIGEAFKWIQRGDMDAAIAGGAEAALTEVGVGGFAAMRALSTRNDEPQKASRPFDQGRDGFVIGEGAAVFVLEELDAAKKRGAQILAEVRGYGATSDAYHLTQPAPEGEGAQRAMKRAMKDAGVNPDDIDYVNAHATSTPVGDGQELVAIKSVFGDHARNGLWTSSTKSMTGHLLGAAGSLEAGLGALAIRDGIVPPTINLDDPDPQAEGLDLVPHEARRRPLRHLISNSFGFGGTNVSLILSKPDG